MPADARIEIVANGPYRVYGDIPLKVMSPVYTLNGEPVAWHTLSDLAPAGQPYELCRCGQSRNKPFCDSTHESQPFDGAETADRGAFLERARFQRVGDEVLADDRSLCIMAGFCHSRTTSVWDLFQDETPAARDRMRQMVENCPSGRIALFRAADGSADEAELAPEIAVLPGGPLWVRGRVPVIGADGKEWEARNRVTMCRCGASNNKPFCDAAHAKIHFDER